jgi:hypothetical protein
VSELIHNSSNHRNLEQAKVIVYFQEIIDKVRPGSRRSSRRAAHASGACACPWAGSRGPGGPLLAGQPASQPASQHASQPASAARHHTGAPPPSRAQEGDDYDVVPNSDFTVTRTANRNNTSDYYVNSKRMSTKEVTTLLKEKGIDLDNNRFLILQVGPGASSGARPCCARPRRPPGRSGRQLPTASRSLRSLPARARWSRSR